ncbi:MAG: protein-disulfide reductase DsbD [Zoogloeaceae bacterium]|jgi:thiol:disulfide interchange protein DsbD|nr:protein-disulfide reductase DsbD [Zoogloeaceae bacterium]
MRRLHAFFFFVFLSLLPALSVGKDFLDPSLAFQPSLRALDDRTLEVRFAIAPEYYLYRERFRFTAENVTLGEASFPQGKRKIDDTFGEVEVYYDEVAIVLPVERNSSGVMLFPLSIVSQGCAESGLCYLPQTHRLTAELPPEGSAPPRLADEPPLDESGFFAERLGKPGFWGKLFFFFAAGLGLALTPCVFPMLPILSGIIVGQGETVTRGRAFFLSLFYVLGMAIAYAAAGVAAGLSGTLLSNLLQTPWVLFSFAALFVLLACAMFGLYTLQLPVVLQNCLAGHSRRRKGGHFLAVFLMGVLSALIVGPCVAAPLAGALLYIGKSGDALLGGAALFVMALGMGVPLLAIGLSAGALLPRAGAWMNEVKKGFGVLLLATAVWIVSPVVAGEAVMLAYALILIVGAVALRALDPLPPEAGGAARFWKGIGIVFLLWGAALFVGALSGSRDPLQPLAGLRAGNASPATEALPFERVGNLAELEARLREAAAAGQPALLDFYADWCVSCKEMERFTFADPAVRSRLQSFVRLRADVTAGTSDDRALLQRFKLYGPPGILFFDRKGEEIPDIRVVGFQNAAAFLQVLARVSERSDQ